MYIDDTGLRPIQTGMASCEQCATIDSDQVGNKHIAEPHQQALMLFEAAALSNQKTVKLEG